MIRLFRFFMDTDLGLLFGTLLAAAFVAVMAMGMDEFLLLVMRIIVNIFRLLTA